MEERLKAAEAVRLTLLLTTLVAYWEAATLAINTSSRITFIPALAKFRAEHIRRVKLAYRWTVMLSMLRVTYRAPISSETRDEEALARALIVGAHETQQPHRVLCSSAESVCGVALLTVHILQGV